MNKLSVVWFALAGCLLAVGSGCATVVSGKYQTISVKSEPSGVTVRTLDGTSVTTPGNLKLERTKKHVVTAELQGCESQQRELRSDLNGWLFGNILLGGVIGAVVDVCSGASGTLCPAEVYFDFTEKGQALAKRQGDFIRDHPALDPKIRFALSNGIPVRGMTKEQLLVCIGDPAQTLTQGKYEVLVYENRKPKKFFLKKDVVERSE
jgi:hypothetical protein